MKKLFSLVLVLVLALSLTACKKETKAAEYVYPQVSDSASKAFEVTINEKTLSLTKDELFNTVKAQAGLSLLLEELDSELLKDRAVDQALFTARKNRLIYGVQTQEEIDLISAEEKAECEEHFAQQMNYMGLTTQALQDAYITLLAKRDKVTKDYLISEANNSKSDLYISNSTLETYYNEYIFTADRKAIIIDFDNQGSLRNTLKAYNLVIFNSELRGYTGQTPIENITQSQLNFDNTAILTDAQILEKFVAIYNDVYNYKTQVTVDNVATQAEFTRNYKVLSENAAALAKYIFKMNKNDYTYTTYRSTTSLGTTYSLVYALDDNTKVDFTAEMRNAILEKYLNDRIYQSYYQNMALTELREASGLKFYDKFLAYDYYVNVNQSFDYTKAMGDSELLVACGDIKIKADDYLAYALNMSQARFVTLALLNKAVEKTPSFALAYGTETDLNKNASLRKLYYFDKVQSDLTTNYKEETYGSEEMYLYQKYGVITIADEVLSDTVSDLKSWLVSDLILQADENGIYSFVADFQAKVQEIIDEYYNNYYNLKPYVINVYTDYNQDYVADDLTKVIANPAEYGVDATKAAQIENKLAQLYTVITSKFTAETKEEDVETVLSDFVKEYNASSITDGTYSEYKKLGLKVEYKKISSTATSTGAVTYVNYGYNQTASVNQALRTLFTNIDADSTKAYYYLNEMVTDVNGSHFYVAIKGDTQRFPSYKYTLPESQVGKINAGAVNTEDKPSLTQVANALNVYLFSLIASKADLAKENFNVDEYPLEFPSSIDLSNYRTAVGNYFINDNWIYGVLAKAVSDAQTDAALKASFKSVSDYFFFELEE